MLKYKILAAAMLAAFSSANAVYVSTDTGQVLIGPYYTVQNGQETILSIVNTSADTKAIKVRFLEAVNSRDVLDFNLYMSPFDVWTAKLTHDEGTGGVRIISPDESCTTPIIPEEGEPFRKIAYDGTHPDYPLDGGDTTYARLREGHFEIIEMGIADPDSLGAWDRNDDGIPDSTHVAGSGIPERCATFVENWTIPTGEWDESNPLTLDTLPPTGGLFGSAAVIDVQVGTEFDVPLTVLDQFSLLPIHARPGTLKPDLRDAFPSISEVRASDKTLYVDAWDFGVNAVSAVLMADRIFQEYSVNPNVEAETAWVVSFPTKHEHVDLDVVQRQPFTREFEDGISCDPVSYLIWDREEENVEGDEPGFSPMPPSEQALLCYETNVINFNGGNPLSSGETSVNFDSGFKNGWGVLGFRGVAHKMTSLNGNTHYGLPVIGFRTTRLGNSNVGIGAAYSVANEFKYRRTVSGSGE